MPQFESNNQFNVLPDDDDGGSSGEISDMEQESAPITPKIPPIKVLSAIDNMKAFHAQLSKVADVHFRSLSSSKNIFCNTVEDFKKVKKFLEEKGVEYHTFTFKADLCKKLVLKGLDRSYTAEEVQNDLIKKTNKVKLVKQMTVKSYEEEATNKQQPRKVPIGIYMVYVSRDTVIEQLIQDIQYVLRHKISWERPRKQNKIATQCTRCGRWGHANNNCGMRKKCLICSGPHTLAEHKTTHENDAESKAIKCPNCKGDHVGSYKNCESFKKYLSERKGKITMQRQRAGHTQTRHAPREIYNTENYTHQNISYRDVVTNTQQQQYHPTTIMQRPTQQCFTNENNTSGFLEGESMELFNMPFAHLMQKFIAWRGNFSGLPRIEREITWGLREWVTVTSSVTKNQSVDKLKDQRKCVLSLWGS
ncbi:hypothetical protein DMENIID0001_124990 [Sergentomyia squamirostris]